MNNQHIIKFPSGKYGFVGFVHWSLLTTAPTEKDAQDDMLLPGNFRKYKTRVWDTEKAARAALNAALNKSN